MVYTLILAVSKHLNINLHYYTYFNIGVLQFFLILLNFILKFKHYKETFYKKMLTQWNLLTSAYWNFLTTYMVKDLILPVSKLEVWIVLQYLEKSTSSITKIRLTWFIGKHLKFWRLRLAFQASNRLKKIMFLKLCNPTLFINLSAEATQLPTTGNLQTYEASGFRTIEYFPQNR